MTQNILCVYCCQLKPLPKKGEHIILKGLGGRAVTKNVCGDCNQEFGDELDNKFLRHGPVAYYRYADPAVKFGQLGDVQFVPSPRGGYLDTTVHNTQDHEVKTQIHIVGNDFLIFRPEETAAEMESMIESLKGRDLVIRPVIVDDEFHDGRICLRERPGLVARIQRIGNRVTNGVYVDRLLACADRVRFVLIHPAQARGFVLNASAVRNNFHLWILLEDTLLQDDRLHDARPSAADTERARLHFFEPYAWRDWPLALITEAANVDGFASPAALEVVAGELPVLLAAPSTAANGWPKGYAALLHDAHQPRVDVERELTRAEVDLWLERCAL